MSSESSTIQNKERWLPIVATLVVVFGVMILAFSYKSMRRRDQMRAALARDAPRRQGYDPNILGRHFPTHRYRPHTTNHAPVHQPMDRPGWAATQPEPGQDRTRTASRWWAIPRVNPRPARREEGLNEFGEAPPPYEQPNASRKDDGVPLGDLPPSRDGNAAPGTNSPPAYAGDTNGVGRPPPAMLPGQQRYG